MRKLFLTIGQSNMCDRGVAADLPVFANADRMKVYKRPIPAAETNVRGTWADAVDVIDPAGATAGSAGAMQLAFLNRMCELFPDDEIAVVPRSVPGVSIDTFVKSNRNNTNYGMALERVWWALEDSPEPCEIAGVIWWQGEADAATTNANVWANKFSQLISEIRVDLQDLSLPVVFVRLGEEALSTYTYWGQLRTQQNQMTMKNLKRVDIDDLPSLSDKVHYPTASYLAIGQRIADAMHPLLST